MNHTANVQNPMETVGFDEKMRLTDLLDNEKQVSGVYNTFINESVTGEVRNCLCGLLSDEHEIQNDVFNEMSTRGFYQTEKAPEDKIAKEKQKYIAFGSSSQG